MNMRDTRNILRVHIYTVGDVTFVRKVPHGKRRLDSIISQARVLYTAIIAIKHGLLSAGSWKVLD